IDVPVTKTGAWANPGYSRRGQRIYSEYFRDEVERIADETMARLTRFLNSKGDLLEMRLRARATAVQLFDAQSASRYWDDLYECVTIEETVAYA
ncbi:MAG TPA: hypothetical protein VK943_15250, partial [Arenibaculum sp.]|nr:hypothetical protein [Arenibaculum sp.]